MHRPLALLALALALVAAPALATVSTTSTQVAYTGDGAISAFPVPFPFIASSDLVVTRTLAGVLTTLVLGVDYTVTGGHDAVGTLTTTTAPPSGATLTITRSGQPLTQPTAFPTQGPFLPKALEQGLDSLTLLIQQLQGQYLPAELAALEASISGLQAEINALGVSPGTVNAYSIVSYGAKCDGATDDTTAIQAALTAAGAAHAAVYVPPSTGGCVVAVGSALSVPSNVSLIGAGTGGSKLKKAAGTWTAALVLLNGVSHVTIADLELDGGGATAAFANIQVVGASSDIKVTRVYSHDGYSDLWIQQGDRIKVSNNHFSGGHHPLYVGGNTTGGGANDGGNVTNLVIEDNLIHGASSTALDGCGIKLVKNVLGVLISGNDIWGNEQDAIDTFAGGNGVTIVGNHLHDNTIHGLDVKANEIDYPTATWGGNRDLLVSSNRFYNNGWNGLKCFADVVDGGAPYNFTVSSNQFIQNGANAVENLGCPDMVVSSNVMQDNCTISNATVPNCAAVKVYGRAGATLQNGLIIGNTISGGGTAAGTNYGITLNTVDRVSVIGNAVGNYSWATTQSLERGIYLDATVTNTKLIGNVMDSTLSTTFDIAAGAGYEAMGNTPNTSDRLYAPLFLATSPIHENATDAPYFLTVTGGAASEQTKGVLFTTKGFAEQARIQVSASGTLALEAGSTPVSGFQESSAGNVTLGATGKTVTVVGTISAAGVGTTLGATAVDSLASTGNATVQSQNVLTAHGASALAVERAESNSGGGAFSTAFSTAPLCFCQDSTTPATAPTCTATATDLTIGGTGADTVKWFCIGLR